MTTMHCKSRPALLTAAVGRLPIGRGFTLIELLIVMALLGTLIALAAPSFLQFQRNSRLRSVSTSLVSAIAAARSEAMKRQKYTFVEPRGGNWNAGWDVYVDMDSNLAFDKAVDLKVGDQADKPSDMGVTIKSGLPAASNYIMFSGSGFPRNKAGAFLSGTITASIEGSNDTKRSIVLANTGRVRVCDPSKTKDAEECPDATK